MTSLTFCHLMRRAKAPSFSSPSEKAGKCARIGCLSMEERSDSTQRRPPQGTNYRLNVIQIPILRALGSLILCAYVFLYDLLIHPPFVLERYLAFVVILATYSLA